MLSVELDCCTCDGEINACCAWVLCVLQTCRSVTFNASGTLLLSGWDDGTVRCFLPESGALKWEQYDASGGGVNVVVGTNCGTKFVTGGADSQIRLWRIFEKGVELQGLVSEHAGEITSIMLSKNDEEAVSSSLDGSCIVWDMTKFSRKQIIMANSLFMAVKSVTLPIFPDRPFVGPLATLDQTQMPAWCWDSRHRPSPCAATDTDQTRRSFSQSGQIARWRTGRRMTARSSAKSRLPEQELSSAWTSRLTGRNL